MSAVISEILGSFSLDQLRDLAFAMSGHGVKPPKQSVSKEDLLKILKERRADQNLALFAHRIEAVTPYKHLFVYSLDLSQSSFPRLKGLVDAAYPNLVGGFREVDASVGDFEPQACLADRVQNRIYLKLAHEVRMSGWVTISRTQKELKEFRKRHPVVITLRPEEGMVTIGFPGFTYVQGVQHEERTAYASIAAQGVELLREKIKVDCRPFQAKSAIDALLEEEPKEVTDIKRNVRPLKGGRFAFDAGEEGRLTTALTDFLTKEGDIAVTESQIRGLLRRSGASDIVLLWRRLEILTRVALLQDGPEFLFIWRDSGPSSSVVDSVLQKIGRYAKLLSKPTVSAVRSDVLATPLDQVIRPAIVAQQRGITRGEVMEIINLAVARRTFEPRFRVNTDALLPDFANVWRASLSEFPPKVVDENGEFLDLTLPTNIEVAFQRVK